MKRNKKKSEDIIVALPKVKIKLVSKLIKSELLSDWLQAS